MLNLTSAIFLLTLVFLISWLFVVFVVYFTPLIIAHIRKHENIVAITILNIILGWTFFGWLAALLWSLNNDVEKEETEQD